MKPAGGTELAKSELFKRLLPETLERVNIVARPEDFGEDKPNVLWAHDMPKDMLFLAEPKERRKFSGIVFVSSWQQTVFAMNMGVSFSESAIIRNAIEPIEEIKKPNDGTVRLIYHPTPHRGLEILVPVFIKLCEKYDFLHLDVFSNFDIYNRPESNQPFEPVYEACKNHERITYHGTQPYSVVREALKKADIFSYPSIWLETSCRSAMEAMSAKCLVVAPDYGALPETLANFNIRYDWHENPQVHAQRFFSSMCKAIESIHLQKTQELLVKQKEYADTFYSWDRRIDEWESYLSTVSLRKPVKPSVTWMER